jgi:long-chain acyl-CoA synthetase
MVETAKRLTSLLDMQEHSCAQQGEREFLGTKVRGRYVWTSYRRFGELVDRARAALAAQGVGRGDKVAVISDNRVEWAVAAYASYGLGASYVPMYEAQTAQEWAYILRDCGAKLLLTSTTAIYDRAVLLGRAGTGSGVEPGLALPRVLCFEAPLDTEHSWGRQLELGAARPVPSVRPGPDDVADLIYTSGTTGKPKGVVLSHRNLASNVEAVRDVFPIAEDDVSCSFLPWAHSFGQTAELHLLMSRGAAIGLAQSPQTLMDDLLLVRPTLLLAVPRIFNRIHDGLRRRIAHERPSTRWMFERGLAVAAQRRRLAERGEDGVMLDLQHAFFDRVLFRKVRARFGGRLRYVISGGAALSREVAELMDDLGILVFEGYGLTETSPIVTTNTPAARRLGTVGKPIPGVSVYVCDADGKPLPRETDGEIVVVGPNVMQGYHRLPEATAAVIFELEGQRALRTGDMGRIDADGFVKITGRFKEQYKLENGKYVVPTVLEEQLARSDLIDQAFVYGDDRPYNVCLVVPDFPALAQWAAAQGITDTSPAALCADERAHAKIGEELAREGAGFRGYEKPRRWALLVDPLTVDDGLLTPKLSVKRPAVAERYAAVIEGLYAGPGPTPVGPTPVGPTPVGSASAGFTQDSRSHV